MDTEKFLYRREVTKSVLHDGFGIDREYLPVFLSGTGGMTRGESRQVIFWMGSKPYSVTIKNLNNPEDKQSLSC